MSHKPKLAICTNCSTSLKNQENFCPNCGQENHDLKIPIGHLIYEAVESVFHFDNKLGNTAKLLLFKPGVVSKQFNEGKRARFVPPFRLYIFISFVFFFIVSLTNHPEEGTIIAERTKTAGSDIQTGFYTNSDIKKIKAATGSELDSIILREGFEPSTNTRYFYRKLADISSLSKAEFQHRFLKNISILMFLLMPYFAFILMLFYLKKKKFYFELLIFSIHFHSFTFILLGVLLGINYFFNLDVFFPAALILFIYLLLALRNFFQQSVGKTFIKTLLLSLTYFFSLCFFMILTLLVSLI
jgi:hypothetical protein